MMNFPVALRNRSKLELKLDRILFSATILISCKFLEIKNYSSFGKGVSSAISTRNCWEMVTAKNTEIDSRIMLRAGYKFIANRIVREISLVYITRGKQSNVQLKQI